MGENYMVSQVTALTLSALQKIPVGRVSPETSFSHAAYMGKCIYPIENNAMLMTDIHI